MAKISQYESRGKKYWQVIGYLGKDELTNEYEKYRKRGFKSKKEAQLAFTRAKLDFEETTERIKDKNITYAELYEAWLKVYVNNVESSTLNKTKQHFRLHILPYFGSKKIGSITSDYIQTWLNDIYVQFKKYKEIYNNFKRIITYAVTQKYLNQNPCDRVSIPQKKLEYDTHRGEKKFYSKDELEYLMYHLEKFEPLKWYAFFRLLAFTGMRKGEALALTWQDIDFDNHILSIKKALKQGDKNIKYVGDPKNIGSNRTISVDDKTLSVLQDWKAKQYDFFSKRGIEVSDGTQLLFSKVNSNTYLDFSTPRNRLVNICDRAGIPFINIHGFRHTHASLMFEAGINAEVIKERLGHTDIGMTLNVYTHLTNTTLEQSAKQFAEYVKF